MRPVDARKGYDSELKTNSANSIATWPQRVRNASPDLGVLIIGLEYSLGGRIETRHVFVGNEKSQQ